jgi:hypothetical protein
MPPRKRTMTLPNTSEYQHTDDTRLNDHPAELADVPPIPHRMKPQQICPHLQSIYERT